ncbi:hypothetical protein G9A89_001855 [Geosiphon pyriformis]|nr:hypothetical protein G9A89_001855 [Geosiphon pyriformis]
MNPVATETPPSPPIAPAYITPNPVQEPSSDSDSSFGLDKSLDSNRKKGLCQRKECENLTRTFRRRYRKTYDAYCSKDCFWAEAGELKETKLTFVGKSDSDYHRIAEPFRSNGQKFKIKRILRLQMPADITRAHFEYREFKEIINTNINTKESSVHEMYHGTRLACDARKIITKGELCNLPSCGVCGIAKEGNKTSLSRHGNKMWFSSDPNISRGYCDQSSRYFGMFVVDVISSDKATIKIVDKNEATLPRFLIIFNQVKRWSCFK